MYPDLSYIFHDLFGTQPDNFLSIVKTFGLFLVLAILSAAVILAKELKRKEEEGLLQPRQVKVVKGKPASISDLLLNGLLGFVLGFKFFYIFSHFPEFQEDPAAVVLSLKGNWLGGIVVGALFAVIKYFEKKKEQLPEPKETVMTVRPYERIGDITVVAALSGIVGAKIFAVAEDIDELLAGNITIGDMVNQFFSGSGMAIYGGLIIAFIVCYWYLRRLKITPIHVMDGVAPALMIAYGVGRLGCHFSGDGDWGIVNEMANPGWIPDWLWAYDYPHNVIDGGDNEHVRIEGCEWRYCTKLSPKVFPTPVYETIMAFILGGVLWMLRKRIKIAGMLFFIYVIMNGFERFWIEKIRINERDTFFGVSTTQAEFIAVVLMIIGVIGCIVVWQRHKRKPPEPANV